MHLRNSDGSGNRTHKHLLQSPTRCSWATRKCIWQNWNFYIDHATRTAAFWN